MKFLHTTLFKALIVLNASVWIILFVCFNYQILEYIRKRNPSGTRVVYEISPIMGDETLEIILRRYPSLIKYLNERDQKVVQQINGNNTFDNNDTRYRVSINDSNINIIHEGEGEEEKVTYCRTLFETIRSRDYSRSDVSRSFLIYDSLLKIYTPGLNTTTTKTVHNNSERLLTLCTQVSAKALGHLPILADSWPGPISLSLFLSEISLPQQLLAIALFLNRLNMCFRRNLSDAITISLAIPWNRTKSWPSHDDTDSLSLAESICYKKENKVKSVESCEPKFISDYYSKLMNKLDNLTLIYNENDTSNSWTTSAEDVDEYQASESFSKVSLNLLELDGIDQSKILLKSQVVVNPSVATILPFLYPQNMMRNIAIGSARTPFIFSVDGDLHLPPLLYQNLTIYLSHLTNNQVESSIRKKVLVIPCYEVSELVPDHNLPKDKSQLLELEAKRLVRIYHIASFAAAQRATDYKTWQNLSLTDPFKLGYKITYKMFYEPFHVAHITAPAYEEKFIGYGCTRNTQALEMSLAGYKFYAFNHAFCLHKKFDLNGSRPKWRLVQNYKNLLRFATFREILYAKYGKTVKLGAAYENLFNKHNHSLRKMWLG